MNKGTLTLVLILSSLIIGCNISVSDERGFKTSNTEYMNNLMLLLDKRGIQYQYSGGYIRYKKKDEAEFKDAQERLYSVKGAKFEEEEVRNYYRNLLDEESIDYIIPQKDNGTWTLWWPDSENQQREIELKTVEYAFSLRRTTGNDDCNNRSRDMPSNKSLQSTAECGD